ncbi:MAG: hypothetical protein ACI81V_000529 [Lentimonas sp.]|jgi:hypothetical protein
MQPKALRFISEIKKPVMLTNKELHQFKWLLGVLLSALSLWSLWALDLKSEGYLLAGFLVLGLLLAQPTLMGRVSLWGWRWIGAGLLLLIAADFALHLPEFMPPLLRMVILLLLYRMLAPRSRREDLQVLLLALFCLVLSGVLTLSLLFAVQILLFAPLAMSLLFVICLLDRGAESRIVVPDLQGLKWLPLMRRVLRVLDFRVLLLGAALFAGVVAVSTVLFVLTPRFDLNQTLPFLQISGQARSGFSDEVGLGEVSEIVSDNSVALRIDVPSQDSVIAAPYWRMLVLDAYESGSFRMSDSLKQRPLRTFSKTQELMGRMLQGDPRPAVNGVEAAWTLYWEGGLSQYLPLPGGFHAIHFEGLQDIELLPGMHLLGLDAVKQRVFSYQIEGVQFTPRFSATEAERDAFSAMPAMPVDSVYPWTTLALDLSGADLEALRGVNQLIAEGETGMTAVDYAAALQRYLWANHQYSLRPQTVLNERDPVVQWLGTGGVGHCEYFAGASVLLARAAGYPARMVVGFSGGSWNSIESYFVVRNSDAHAWVEVYDALAGEWFRVDPTPGSFSPGGPQSQAARQLVVESGWAAWVDSLRIQWYRRIVNFDQADQIDLAKDVQGFWRQFSESFGGQFKAALAVLKGWWVRPLSGRSLLQMGGVLVALAAGYGIWRLRQRLLLTLAGLLGRAAPVDPVRRKASDYLRRCAVRSIEGRVKNELRALRFGPSVGAKDAAAIFERAKQALRRR